MTLHDRYDVEVTTPVGPQRGSLELAREGGTLTGTLTTPAGPVPITDGTLDGERFSFTTKVKTPMGKMTARVSGVLEGDRLTATAKLPLGSAQISGVAAGTDR